MGGIMADEPDFDLALSPGHLLHRAQQFAADRFSETTGGVEVTQRQFAVLCAVNAQEGLTQTQLVAATGIDRSTLAELVSRMAAKGLLVREKAPGDARANAVRFTDEGRKLYATAIEGAKAADEAILGALEEDDYLGLLREAGFAEVEVMEEKPVDVPDEALAEVLSPDELRAYREGGSVLASITVVGIRPEAA